MAGLRIQAYEDRVCEHCDAPDSLVVDKGALVCNHCGVIHAERLISESLEYSNTHNAKLDEDMRVGFMRRGGKVVEYIIRSKWCERLKNEFFRMAHDKELAIGEDVAKCAVELMDAVEKLHEIRVVGGKQERVRMFHTVQRVTQERIKWAVLLLAHDACQVYATLDALNGAGAIDVMKTNALVRRLRGALKIQPFCPSEENHVRQHIRSALVAEVRAAGGVQHRPTLAAMVKRQQEAVMSMWSALDVNKEYSMKYAVKSNPDALLGVYRAQITKKKVAGTGAKKLAACLKRIDFDLNKLAL